MRSARMILASAAPAPALAIATPGAHASGGDESHDDSSYSQEDDSSHGKGDDSSHGKGHGDSHSKEDGNDSSHDEPRGGMHTGGGALTALTSDDWSSDSGDNSKYDPETYKDKDSDSDHDKGSDSDSGRGKDSWDDDTDKPSGGMHTGGGGLATPGGVTTGGLAVLAVGATGLYALRRKHAAGSAS
ncbi:hypothetical protein [Streptomyces sp. NPDC058964]|uniref:hypothetical protein n=1 Tax=Streptomyces sp. NPDC058964 TaxID=3346681 RepID=UPI0036AA8C3B